MQHQGNRSVDVPSARQRPIGDGEAGAGGAGDRQVVGTQVGPTADRPVLRDLDDPEQVAEMVRRFYADVASDDLLGPMFNDVAEVDWTLHLPKLTAFWCRALLSIPGYSGNPFRAHLLVHRRAAFTRAHFERWLSLFRQTVHDGWNGPRADQALDLASKVAQVHSHQLTGDALAS